MHCPIFLKLDSVLHIMKYRSTFNMFFFVCIIQDSMAISTLKLLYSGVYVLTRLTPFNCYNKVMWCILKMSQNFEFITFKCESTT